MTYDLNECSELSSGRRRRLTTNTENNTTAITEPANIAHVDTGIPAAAVAFVAPPIASKGSLTLVNVTVMVFAVVSTVEGNST